MLSLLKIEWLKIKKYPAFWWMLGIVALTYPGINWILQKGFETATSQKDMTGNVAKMLIGNPFAFPDAWHSVAYFSSFFVLVPAILIIMLISNEYTFKTSRQNIIDGWSRNQFITAKLIDVFIISLIVTISYFIVAATFGIIYSDSISLTRWNEELQYIPLFFLQTFAQLTIAALLGFLIRKAFFSLGVFFFYYLIIENVIYQYLKFKNIEVRKFLPFEISNRLIPFFRSWGRQKHKDNDGDIYLQSLNEINAHVIYTLILIGLIWWLCYYLNKKRDL
jgi:ABC-type transport system involved in multi-copper enzyme maturation permease subunit